MFLKNKERWAKDDYIYSTQKRNFMGGERFHLTKLIWLGVIARVFKYTVVNCCFPKTKKEK